MNRVRLGGKRGGNVRRNHDGLDRGKGDGGIIDDTLRFRSRIPNHPGHEFRRVVQPKFAQIGKVVGGGHFPKFFVSLKRYSLDEFDRDIYD